MASRASVEGFVQQKTLAVVGVSRSGKKFGNYAYKALRDKGYRLFPVHPEAETIEGDPCFERFEDLPEKVGGLLIVLPPEQTEKIVPQAAAAGIERVWMQQGSHSDAAVAACKEHGLDEVHGECILMFAQPASFHKFHRWIWSLLGKLPK